MTNLRSFMENTGLSDEQAIKIFNETNKILSSKDRIVHISEEVIQQIIKDNKKF